jgi:hypothetical protein
MSAFDFWFYVTQVQRKAMSVLRSVHVSVLINAKCYQTVSEILNTITQVIMEIMAFKTVHIQLNSESCERNLVPYVSIAFQLIFKHIKLVCVFEKSRYILFGFGCQQVQILLVSVQIPPQKSLIQ